MKKIGIVVILLTAFMVLGCDKPPEGTVYSVIYHDNGSTSGHVPNDFNEYTTGMEAIVLDKGTLLKTGYTFQHWNTKSDGTGDSYTSGNIIRINYLDVFLYAIWLESAE